MNRILTRDQKIRVFISSTIKELADERGAVRKAISSMEYAPVYFEHGAGPHNLRDVYLAYVEQSHLYIGILWEKYGYVDPNVGISGTEDEYNHATKLSKPKFIYIKSTKSIRDARLETLIKKIEKNKDCVFKEFSTHNDLRKCIKKDIAHFVTEQFLSSEQTQQKTLPDYNKAVLKRVHKLLTIKREQVVQEIKESLRTADRVFLVGEPGIGKTFCLVQFLETEKNCFFLNLKEMQPLQALSFVANKLRQMNKQPISFITSEPPALSVIETESQRLKHRLTFCIDGIEENIDLTKKICGACLDNVRIVCASRKADLLDWPKIEVPRLTKKEIKGLIDKWKKKISDSDLADLIDASEGNPLYLYYFVKFNLRPLPKGLAAYQEALWGSLNSSQKKILRLISLAILPIHTRHLRVTFINSKGSQGEVEDIQQIINLSRPLINQINGWLTIFHKYFEEFIKRVTEKEGLTIHYHELLWKAYDAEKERLARTYHLATAGDKSVKPLEPIITKAYFAGLNRLAEGLLNINIAWAQEEGNNETEAMSSYIIADILFDKGDYQGAMIKSSVAQNLFTEIENEIMACLAKVQALLFQIGHQDAFEISQKILALREDNKKYLTQQALAILAINLSLAFKQAGCHYEGAMEAKQAYIIFEEIGDVQGMLNSIVNLNACLGQLGQHTASLQKNYAELMISEARKRGWPRLKLAGLNHLTQALRKLKQYPEAKKYAQESIALSRQLRDAKREIMNLCNLGNVLKDEKNMPKALERYEEAVTKARQVDDQVGLGHALEMTAGCYRGEKIELAVKRIEEAIAIQTRLANYFRLGECYVEYGEIMEAKKDLRSAAEKYQEATSAYQKAGHIDKMIGWCRYSARLFNETGDNASAVKLLQSAFNQTKLTRPDQAGRILDMLDAYDNSCNHCKEYESLMKEALNKADRYDFALSALSFATAVFKEEGESTRKTYKNFLFEMAQLSKSRKTVLNALAVALDQSTKVVLNEENLEDLIKEVVLSEEHFYYHRDKDVSLFTVAIINDRKPYFIEIECYSDYWIDRKTAFSLALTILANEKYFQSHIIEKGGFKELAHKIIILPFDDFSREVFKEAKIPDKQTPAICTASNMPYGEEQPPSLIVLHPEYEKLTLDALYPENKSFVWLIMNICQNIITHFAHVGRSGETARESRLLCENIFARGLLGDNQEDNLSKFILPGLADKIKKINHVRKNGKLKNT